MNGERKGHAGRAAGRLTGAALRAMVAARGAIGAAHWRGLAAALPALLFQVPAVPAAVRFGDAVPGIIHASDLERIRRQLHLTAFSVIAAVRLSATDGREAVIAEPLEKAALARLVSGCEGGAYCPDPVGFVAARVRIVRLCYGDIVHLMVADRAIRDGRGRPLDPGRPGFEGPFLGWNGRAEAASGHVALRLTPLLGSPEDGPGGGGAPADAGAAVEPGIPIEIVWDEAAGRFRVRR